MSILHLGTPMPGQGSVTTTIINEIAAREQKHPLDLDEPLYSAVDVDALERLVTHGGEATASNPITIEFTYAGYSVTVDGSGHVTVTNEPATATADSSSAKGSTDD